MARRRDARGQPAEQGQRIHVDGDGPVGVGLLQDDADQAVLTALELLLRDGRPQHVAQQRLAAYSVERTCARGRVEREAVLRGAERLVVRERFGLGGLRRITH